MLRGQPSTERCAWHSRPRDQYRESPVDRCARLFFAFLSAPGLTVGHLTFEVIVGQKHSRHVRTADEKSSVELMRMNRGMYRDSQSKESCLICAPPCG